MSEYKVPVMYLDGIKLPVENVVAMAMNAGIYAVAEHYINALLWHLSETDDPLLRKRIQEIRRHYHLQPYQKAPTSMGNPQPGMDLTNYIFKKKISYIQAGRQVEKELDLLKLHTWIKTNVLPYIVQKYSWFALWKLFFERNLLNTNIVSKFVTQMNEWFPDANILPNPIAINLWKNGYLGDNPYMRWNFKDFIHLRRDKQTDEGFNHLQNLITTLSANFTPWTLIVSHDK